MKFAIIGFGHLGNALASGLKKSGSAGAGDIYVCDNSPMALAAAEKAPFYAQADFVLDTSSLTIEEAVRSIAFYRHIGYSTGCYSGVR